MVSQQDRLFYASGALSFGIFLLTLLLFASVLFNYDAVKSYALSKQDYIAVSLVSVPLQKRPTKEETKTSPVKEPLPVKEPEPQTEEELITTPEAFKDASTLFENVWTQEVSAKKRPMKKPESDTKRISAIEKRIKTAQKSQQHSAAAKISSVKLAKPSVSVEGSATSAAAEVNEYYAKIQAIVYNHFNPPVNSEGNSARVYLRLDADGRLKDARILVPSGQPLFDNEVEALLRRLNSAVFPASPEGRPIELKIILTAEE